MIQHHLMIRQAYCDSRLRSGLFILRNILLSRERKPSLAEYNFFLNAIFSVIRAKDKRPGFDLHDRTASELGKFLPRSSFPIICVIIRALSSSWRFLLKANGSLECFEKRFSCHSMCCPYQRRYSYMLHV